jgi:thiol-disulfide isomerase/thioredoxin
MQTPTRPQRLAASANPSNLRRLVLGAALALTACSKISNKQDPAVQTSAIVVPTDLYLQNVLAGAFTFSQLGGKAILLELWATTCAICVAEMPLIAVLAERYEAKGLRTIALAMPYDRPDLVLHFAKERRLPFTVAIDPAGHLLKSIASQAAKHVEPNLEGTPTRLLLKPSGQLVYREQGSLHGEGQTLDVQIAKLLKV